MAKNNNNLVAKATTILFLATLLLFQSRIALSSDNIDPDTENDDNDDDSDEDFVLDSPVPVPVPGRSGARFLAGLVIKKGTHCDSTRRYKNVCNGVKANKGNGILFCCKKHCRNVLGDRNNCGICGHKCRFGQRCCGGRCTAVLFNPSHCGKCDRRCPPGVACENGVCGYAY